MKAVQVKAFVKNLDDLHPSDAPIPRLTSSHSLRIKITHAAVTHVDLLYAQGLHQNNRRHVQPPFILGTEFAGIVESNSSSSQFPRGTRVFGSGLGSYAENIAVPKSYVREVPKEWTNAQACAVGVSGATSWAGLVTIANVQKGEIVLVLGASGGLGVMAIQIAVAYGAIVIAVVGNAEKQELVTKLGAHHSVNYHDSDWQDQVKRLSPDNEGVHTVYDSIGAVEDSLKCLRYGGKVVIMGFAARDGRVEEVKMNRILLKAATVVGYRFGEHGRRAPQETEAIWTGFMKLVEEGKIKPVVYEKTFSGLESVPAALQDMQQRKAWGRAVITIADEDRLGDRAKI